MPTKRDIANELWLHVNSPGTLDKTVGDQIAKLRSQARMDELSDYQNERKEIDATVDRYLNSPQFESYRQTFLEVDDMDSPELEQAVSEMMHELKHGVTDNARDEIAETMSSDLERLDQVIDRDLDQDAEEHIR